MDEYLSPILVACSVAALFYGIWQVVCGLMDNQAKKLEERLSSDEGRFDTVGGTGSARSITMATADDTGKEKGLASLPGLRGLRRSLLQTWPEMSFEMFLGLCAGVAVLLLVVGFLMTDSIPIGLIAAGLGLYVPFLLLGMKRAKRQRMLADQLPEALDFLSRILRAGHSFSTGLQMMSEELPHPINAEFRRAYDQHSIGASIEDALKDIAKRIESTDFAFFVTAVLIQRQTGGDLSEVLGNISGMIRQRIRLQMHVKSKTAEGRFTGYILTAFPAVMFLIAYTLNPDYAGVLIHTTQGLTLLGTAFGLQMCGLVAIKKITTVVV